MKDNLGCLLFVIDVCLLLYAIFSLLCGQNVLLSWLYIIGRIISALLRIIGQRLIRRRIGRYKREESYWSQKAKEDKEAKETSEGKNP